GLCFPLKTVQRIISGHGKDVSCADPFEGIEDRLDLVPVLVFACKVNDRIDAHLPDLYAEHTGGEGRMAARVIGEREGMDEVPARRLVGKLQHIVMCLPPGPASRYQFYGIDKLVPPVEHFFETISQHF